jgi:hypothetical protein
VRDTTRKSLEEIKWGRSVARSKYANKKLEQMAYAAEWREPFAWVVAHWRDTDDQGSY